MQKQTFAASGGTDRGYVWSLAMNASGGSITWTGAYTAGATGGVTDVVQVTDSLGNSGTASVTVTAATDADGRTPGGGAPGGGAPGGRCSGRRRSGRGRSGRGPLRAGAKRGPAAADVQAQALASFRSSGFCLSLPESGATPVGAGRADRNKPKVSLSKPQLNGAVLGEELPLEVSDARSDHPNRCPAKPGVDLARVRCPLLVALLARRPERAADHLPRSSDEAAAIPATNQRLFKTQPDAI